MRARPFGYVRREARVHGVRVRQALHAVRIETEEDELRQAPGVRFAAAVWIGLLLLLTAGAARATRPSS
jgi:hypothetical protein